MIKLAFIIFDFSKINELKEILYRKYGTIYYSEYENTLICQVNIVTFYKVYQCKDTAFLASIIVPEDLKPYVFSIRIAPDSVSDNPGDILHP